MDAMGEEQLDYGDDDFAGNPKLHHQNSGVGGSIPALAEDEMIGEDDEFDDLYNDVNVGEHFMHNQHQNPNPLNPNPNPAAAPFGGGNNGSLPRAQLANPKIEPPTNASMPGIVAPQQNPNVRNNNNLHNSRVPEYAQGNSHVGDLGYQRGPMAQIPAAKVSPAPVAPRPSMGPVDVNGPTMLFVGDLHWWTTDSDLESVLTQYGKVKEIKFFDERASGKSKGYCQVEFYDAAATAACKEGMNGYEFNGKACVVAFVSPQTLRQMGASYANQGQGQSQQQQGRRQMNDGMGRGGGGDGGGGRNFGRGGWGSSRGGQGMMNRGQGGGMRGRGFAGGKGMVGAGGGGVGNNGPYGQGLGVPAGLGGPAGMMHPQNMMGGGFDPTYMGRGGPYGFTGPAFTGMMPPFQSINTVGLPGVAPHINPAFFSRGMSANGMGVMGSTGIEGQMWGDAGMGGGWTGEEHGRTRESSYGGDDGASEYGYGEVNHERGGRSNASREKERGSERDYSGTSERRHRDDKEHNWDRSDRERHREEDGYRDYRSRDRDFDKEVDWDREQSSSRSRSKSYMQEDDHGSRSRDADYVKDYGKRRRE